MPDWRARLTVDGYCAALWLAKRVPPRIAYPVLAGVAGATYRLSTGARRAVEENLAQVLGARGPGHTRAVRQVFRHNLWNYYDTFRQSYMSDAELLRFVQLHGTEHVRAALARGTGAIMVTAHLSSPLVGAQALAVACGTRGICAVEPIEPPALRDLMVRVRDGHSVQFVPLGPRLAVEMAASLRRNELVFLVVDRDVGGGGLRRPFFGRDACLPSGPALLALRTGAPIIPAVVSRRRDGRVDGTVDAPVCIDRTGDLRSDLRRITDRVTARLEYHIARHPEQWTVLQRVWGAH
ncbi:MAG: hypothetical protein IT305_08495 [Chloroflexi bacterium]|nr:hypothetical protein [Chloroflexota bacterium]